MRSKTVVIRTRLFPTLIIFFCLIPSGCSAVRPGITIGNKIHLARTDECLGQFDSNGGLHLALTDFIGGGSVFIRGETLQSDVCHPLRYLYVQGNTPGKIQHIPNTKNFDAKSILATSSKSLHILGDYYVGHLHHFYTQDTGWSYDVLNLPSSKGLYWWGEGIQPDEQHLYTFLVDRDGKTLYTTSWQREKGWSEPFVVTTVSQEHFIYEQYVTPFRNHLAHPGVAWAPIESKNEQEHRTNRCFVLPSIHTPTDIIELTFEQRITDTYDIVHISVVSDANDLFIITTWEETNKEWRKGKQVFYVHHIISKNSEYSQESLGEPLEFTTDPKGFRQSSPIFFPLVNGRRVLIWRLHKPRICCLNVCHSLYASFFDGSQWNSPFKLLHVRANIGEIFATWQSVNKEEIKIAVLLQTSNMLGELLFNPSVQVITLTEGAFHQEDIPE